VLYLFNGCWVWSWYSIDVWTMWIVFNTWETNHVLHLCCTVAVQWSLCHMTKSQNLKSEECWNIWQWASEPWWWCYFMWLESLLHPNESCILLPSLLKGLGGLLLSSAVGYPWAAPCTLSNIDEACKVEGYIFIKFYFLYSSWCFCV